MDLEPGQMPDIPQWLELLLWATVAIALVWLSLTLFVYMRRKASNLTPVNAPSAKKSAAPDFLKVDQKARDAQIQRGENFEKVLDEREASEAAEAEERKGTKQVTMFQRLAGLATLLFSIFSLLSTIVGVVWQVDRIGGALSQTDAIGVMIQKYPIPFAVCVFVIGYYVVAFFTQKQWKAAPGK